MRWLLRIAILCTAIAMGVRGEVAYGGFCIVALAIASGVGRFARGPELALLLLMVADMLLGHGLGLYRAISWYDKALHLCAAALVGLLVFVAVYAVRVGGRYRSNAWIDGLAVLLVTLGIGAVWELTEYAVDALAGAGAQAAPGLAAIDDTMLDLLIDACGALAAAALGPLWLRYSQRSREQIVAIAERLAPARD